VARILIDARNLRATSSGIGTYAKGLIPALATCAPQHEFLVLRHPTLRHCAEFERPRVRSVFHPWSNGGLWHCLAGSRAFAAAKAVATPDLVHSLFHLLPLRPLRREGNRTPQVATFHDAIWVDHPWAHSGLANGALLWLVGRTCIPRSLRAADRVIVPSEASGRRAQAWVRPDRIVVVPHGVSRPRLPPPGQAPLLAQPYIAAIAVDKRYKNLEILLDALTKLPSRTDDVALVLVGTPGRLAREVRRRGLRQRVRLLGAVSDEVRTSVLAGAEALVLPSLVEGFGLPVLEAMAVGTPVIVSDREPMRSIAGEAGLLFDPLDPESLAARIGLLLAAPELAAVLRARALERAASFRWEEAARRTLAVYEELLELAPGGRGAR
jgi:glycosyltransferase involved in cell wall biosynthesis